MNQSPRSWAASIVGFALAVLATAWALNWAAELLRTALPVLIPAAIIAVPSLVGWRRWRGRSQGW